MVYGNRIENREPLKNLIRREVIAITPLMLIRVIDHFMQRFNQCIAANGRHLNDIIFKTYYKVLL